MRTHTRSHTYTRSTTNLPGRETTNLPRRATTNAPGRQPGRRNLDPLPATFAPDRPNRLNRVVDRPVIEAGRLTPSGLSQDAKAANTAARDIVGRDSIGLILGAVVIVALIVVIVLATARG